MSYFVETSTVYLFIMIECLFLGFGHYIPHWRNIFGKLENPIRLMFNYTYGVIAINGSFIGWVWKDQPTEPRQIIHNLIVFTVIGGVVVAFTYLVDGIVQYMQNNKTKTALLERQKDVPTERNQ